MKFPTLGAGAMLAAAMIGGAPLFAAGTAHAATIVQTFVFPQIFIYPVTPTSGNAGFPGFDDEYADQSFNGFNPALGTLESAEISIPTTHCSRPIMRSSRYTKSPRFMEDRYIST